MKDYWNDPPEEPEMPDCPNHPCEGQGEYLYDGKTGQVFSCGECAYQWVIPFPIDPEPTPEPIDEELEEIRSQFVTQSCVHGNVGECHHCDHLSDLAYDSERERR